MTQKELTTKMEQLKNQKIELNEATELKIQERFTSLLGEKFLVIFRSGFQNCRIEVGIKNELDTSNFKFGHEFVISYIDHSIRGNNNYVLELNYGTMGAYNLLEDDDRTDYLFGMATVASNKAFLNDCVAILDDYLLKVEEIRKQIKEIENQLKSSC